MTLDEYLREPDSPNNGDFGARCSPPLSGASIGRIRRGDQNITLRTMRSIIVASGGKVTAEGQDQRQYNDSLYKHYKALYDDAAIVANLNIPTVGLSSLSLNQNYPVDSDDVTDLDYEWEL